MGGVVEQVVGVVEVLGVLDGVEWVAEGLFKDVVGQGFEQFGAHAAGQFGQERRDLDEGKRREGQTGGGLVRGTEPLLQILGGAVGAQDHNLVSQAVLDPIQTVRIGPMHIVQPQHQCRSWRRVLQQSVQQYRN